MGGVGLRPVDADGIDRLYAAEIDDHPLRMRRILVAGEGLGQVGIAFPVGVHVAVGDARITVIHAVVAGEAAMR